MRWLHVFVEEASAEAALIDIIPAVLKDLAIAWDFEIRVFEGKPDLLRKLPQRLKAYRNRSDDVRLCILVDRDRDDCRDLKAQIDAIVAQVDLPPSCPVLVRIAIEELEAWFFGDIPALCAAYPKIDPHLATKKGYRDPDAISVKGGTWQALDALLIATGDHPGGLEKQRSAQAIAGHMTPDANRSRSFQVFRDGLRRLMR